MTLKKIILVIALAFLIACSSYSTARRTESENIINAPINVVWEKTLEIIPTERMTFTTISKVDYFVCAEKSATFWSWGDKVSLRLIPKGERQTLMNISAQSKYQWVGLIVLWGWADFGHEGRMVRNIFDRIKRASESTLPPKEP